VIVKVFPIIEVKHQCAFLFFCFFICHELRINEARLNKTVYSYGGRF